MHKMSMPTHPAEVTKSLEKPTEWVFAHISKLDWHLSSKILTSKKHLTVVIIYRETARCLREFEDCLFVSTCNVSIAYYCMLILS